MASNASSSGSNTSYVQDDPVAEATPAYVSLYPITLCRNFKLIYSCSTPRTPPPSASVTDTITRFTMLYFTSFFSLDPYTAARRSPYSVPNPTVPEHLRPTGRDYGEGEGIGRRLDPGGPFRRQGRIQNDGRNITVPAGCKSCKYNAAPTIG
jgi:hypothetical protein